MMVDRMALIGVDAGGVGKSSDIRSKSAVLGDGSRMSDGGSDGVGYRGCGSAGKSSGIRSKRAMFFILGDGSGMSGGGSDGVGWRGCGGS